MNIVNKILILIIFIFIIDNLVEGKIFKTIKSYILMCKDKIEGFTGLTYSNKKGTFVNHPQVPYEIQRDFPYLNKNDPDNLDDESHELYNFMKDLVTVNTNFTELTPSRNKSIVADKNLVDEIMKQLTKTLNSNGFNFSNIKLLDDIHYHENHRGKEIESFNIKSDISFRGKSIGSVVMNFEVFMRRDNFHSREFKHGLLTIVNVKLIERKYPNNITREKKIRSPYIIETNNEPTTNQKDAFEKHNNLNNNMNKSFNDNFVKINEYEKLFIKPLNSNDSENSLNSLIPSAVDISSYDQYSATGSTIN
jgi:hypothetical protein